jgi:hypothetical protein
MFSILGGAALLALGSTRTLREQDVLSLLDTAAQNRRDPLRPRWGGQFSAAAGPASSKTEQVLADLISDTVGELAAHEHHIIDIRDESSQQQHAAAELSCLLAVPWIANATNSPNENQMIRLLAFANYGEDWNGANSSGFGLATPAEVYANWMTANKAEYIALSRDARRSATELAFAALLEPYDQLDDDTGMPTKQALALIYGHYMNHALSSGRLYL